jgi:serine/threonine protein kinase/nitrite reductase/ring-hydroxylating ferredoxin subunit
MQTAGIDQLVGISLGEYQLTKLLGHGKLSTAYIAQHSIHSNIVMITIFNLPLDSRSESPYASEMQAEHQANPALECAQFLTRFMRESATLVKLKHPNILPTYTFGEFSDHPYLVTALANGNPLNQFLAQQGRLTPQQTLTILKQMAAALDYAHSNGIAHNVLSLSDVLVINQDLKIYIANFGISKIFDMHKGIKRNASPPDPLSRHRLSQETFAYPSPDYTPIDNRSDIYALGMIIFELLCPTHTPQDRAVSKHSHQPLPSVHAHYPDVPEMLDLVIHKTLEQDPALWYQRAGDIVFDFERALKATAAISSTEPFSPPPFVQQSPATDPSASSWFGEVVPDKSSHMTTKQMPAATSSFQALPSDPQVAMFSEEDAWHVPHTAMENNLDAFADINPLSWWAVAEVKPEPLQSLPGTFMALPPGRLQHTSPRSKRQSAQPSRRKVVAMLAAGTVTAGTFALGARILTQHTPQPSSQFANTSANASTSVINPSSPGNTSSPSVNNATQNTASPSSTPTSQPSPTSKPTSQPSPTSTSTPQPSPTSQPTSASQPAPTSQPTSQPSPAPQPSPTSQPSPPPPPPPQPTPTPVPPPPPPPPPSHTGTVIGYTNQSTNSAHSFTNPADGQSSLLVRLPNGNFVATERACTHDGVDVNYDSSNQRLVCPAHHAVFDPSNGDHLSGPGNGPLPTVPIRVNGDGTITTN